MQSAEQEENVESFIHSLVCCLEVYQINLGKFREMVMIKEVILDAVESSQVRNLIDYNLLQHFTFIMFTFL